MCKWHKSNENRIDPCMKTTLNLMKENNIEVIECCCGHQKYSRTVVIRCPNGKIIEFYTAIELPRKKRFYARDQSGYMYIPEVEMAQYESFLKNLAN